MARATTWTEPKLKALKLPDGKAELRVMVDSGLYLHLRAKANGETAKHWLYRAQVAGSRRWLSLGSLESIGLAQAKAETLRHKGTHEAAKKGEADHPVLEARFSRKAKLEQATAEQVFAEWIADKRLGSKRKGGAPVRERTITLLQDSYNADIKARIGEAKIAKLTPEALQSCIDAPRKRGAPGAAAHVYRTLRGLVTFAINRRHIDGADPMRGIENPRPYRPAPVNAANDAELVILLTELERSKIWPATRLAIEFQLLTGARPGEVREAKWGEFNLSRSVWTLPATDGRKSAREFRVHLSPQALNVLAQAKELEGAHGYVFPGASGATRTKADTEAKGGTLEKMAVARALSRLTERTLETGGRKLRPHDLRRTFRTLLSRIGVAPHVAELCLNHQEKETMRRVYDGHDYTAEMADAWDRAGAHIQAIREGAAQVVSIATLRA
ncbi:MAG: tyrosine-type recombinase/integrase [Burkholderiales bacterium]|jgi:integrase